MTGTSMVSLYPAVTRACTSRSSRGRPILVWKAGSFVSMYTPTALPARADLRARSRTSGNVTSLHQNQE